MTTDVMWLGEQNPCLIIAEIGTSHGGNLHRARELIDAAAAAGCDGVKFQMVFADEIIHPLTGEVTLPGGKVRLYDVFKSLEREPDFYGELQAYTEKKGLRFLCTPFGLKSLGYLLDLRVKAIKIASPELNHFPLLKQAAASGLPLILSSGISTLGDIEAALQITGRQVILLHCITQYPAPAEQYNLRLLPHLAAVLGVKTGVSDHSTDPVLVPALAAWQGACLVEKHFTLTSGNKGLDDCFALEPDSFSLMVKSIRHVEQLSKKAGFNWLQERFGEEKLNAVLGSGIKELAPAEQENYHTTNRSLHAVYSLRAGERITAANIAILRSEKNLPPGLDPRFYELILGKRLKTTVDAGAGLEWRHLI